jgi:hypothetical protein
VIKVERRGGRISFEGHADYAPYGYDVVCAAVSGASAALACVADEDCTDESGAVQWVDLGEARATAAMCFFDKIAGAFPRVIQTRSR